MNYINSISDFFKSPKWMTNLLLGGVCLMIPIVGPMVLIGWHITAQFSSPDRVDYYRYPDFDFKNFGAMLQRGLWPVIVNIAASFVMVPIMWVLIFVPLFLMSAVLGNSHSSNSDLAAIVPLLTMLVVFVIIVTFVAVMSLILKPLLIRAAITQDFAAAFNFGFIKDFIKRTWLEMIISSVFLMIVSPLLGLAGFLVFCVGLYLAINVMVFVQWHLDRQIYDLYLTRGGRPVPISPKLAEPLPSAVRGY